MTGLREWAFPPVEFNPGTSHRLANRLVIAVLCLVWLGLVLYGWGRWGSVTIDCGRELFVSAAVAEGKTLYRDVWYPYGPGAPYLNSLLFRVFGIRVEVMYAAGALAALVVALSLSRAMLYFSSWPLAFAIGYVCLVQSFGPGLFNYPLPYCYATVYGSVTACLFLLFALRTVLRGSRKDLFWAGICAAVALLTKLEYGYACFAVLALLLIGLWWQQRSWPSTGRNLLALLPALTLCAAVAAWMVSLGGVEFITHENFMSWPTSYFMQRYGAMWLKATGFLLSWSHLWKGLVLTAILAAFWLGIRLLWLSVGCNQPIRVAVSGLLLIGSVLVLKSQGAYLLSEYIGVLVFPFHMVFILSLAVPVTAFLFWRRGSMMTFAMLVVMSFGALVAIRTLFGMVPRGYAIYYNGPVLLGFFLLLAATAFPSKRVLGSKKFRAAQLFVCAMVCLWVTQEVAPGWRYLRDERAAFTSERGTIYLPRPLLPAWSAAGSFMRTAHEQGQRVLAIPEEAALYFFTGVPCPIRICAMTPGMVVPGHMTRKTIEEIEQNRVRYVIWSNRRFPEYGVPEFGKDFDAEIGDYIRKNYRLTGIFTSPESADTWCATLWERKVETD
ncbi:MAG TPA: hypothetical protein PLP42_19180 [Acidobacteriota bacterium]|nr:hypothetical protein [Acidobacteriota bacterium]